MAQPDFSKKLIESRANFLKLLNESEKIKYVNEPSSPRRTTN